MNRTRAAAALAALLLASAAAVAGSDALPTIAAKTSTLQHLPGLLTLYWDERHGKLYLEVPQVGREMLYVNSLPYGTGSNDLGLDRGELSESKLVRFERFGAKLLLIESNDKFRTSAAAPDERLAVRQSFPESVLAGFKIEAEDLPTTAQTGALLVDATAFFERDAHHVAEALAEHQKEGYKLDAERSAIAPEATRAFPRNIEVEALLTFTTDAPGAGGFVRDVAPDPHALTVRVRQSFIELPGPGFAPRRYDPRGGFFPTGYRDYAAPLGAPLDQNFIVRHRLLKRDAACASACVAERPIQYYVDRGAPEPIRGALVEGAGWWDQAFQAAGWAPGTFRVDLLPEGADPMDVRYNIIHWVHRYTRGWSYGYEISDPRSGEIIKGNVTLGSLRGRQDYLLAEALLSPYVSGRPATAGQDPMLDLVLARLRQLAAHEVGHTLGLAHNFSASAHAHAPDDTVSVMDYPHPWITLGAGGVPDVAHAYGVGIGTWDKVAIDFGYHEFPAGVDPSAALDGILRAAAASGLEYITDEDARPLGGAHPHAHLWDNGTDPAAELTRIAGIRAAALARFGENAVRPGTPVAQLEDTLVPLYLLHRYQTEAAVKEIGGLDYRYQLRGDGQAGPTLVPAAAQRKAIAAVLSTLSPDFLTLPETVLRLLPPRPPGFERTRESLPSHTGLTFDPVAAAECAADLTLKGLFDPARAQRLIEYHAREAGMPDLATLVDAVLEAVRPSSRMPHAHGAGGAPPSLTDVVRDAVYVRAVEAMLTLAADPRAASAVRAAVAERLARLKLAKSRSPVDAYIVERIDQWQRNPDKFNAAPAVAAPPGMPIGDIED